MLNKKIKELYKMHSKYHRSACGIEVELENSSGKWDFSSIVTGLWSSHQEGSLINGVELVSEPTPILEMKNYKESDLYLELDKFILDNKPKFSERASTHVHVNMRDVTLLNVLNIITGYFIVENALIFLCHPSRRGNHFCLSLTDSMTLIDKISRKLRNNSLPFDNNNLKYSSLNIGRMRDLGTIEIRIMSSLTNTEDIFRWAKDISRILFSFERDHDTPFDILTSYINNKSLFLEESLGETLPIIMEKGNVSLHSLIEKIDESIPLLMPLATIDWSKLYNKTFNNRDGIDMGIFNLEYGYEPDFEENPGYLPGVMDIEE